MTIQGFLFKFASTTQFFLHGRSKDTSRISLQGRFKRSDFVQGGFKHHQEKAAWPEYAIVGSRIYPLTPSFVDSARLAQSHLLVLATPPSPVLSCLTNTPTPVSVKEISELKPYIDLMTLLLLFPEFADIPSYGYSFVTNASLGRPPNPRNFAV